MDKILNISDRLKDKKRKEHEEIHRQKAEALQRVVQCSSCQLSCAMCGAHFDVPDLACPPATASTDMTLCESCRAEYNDFLEISKGAKKADIFWHNEEWVNLWYAWLDYREALEAFRTSKEFMQLIKSSDDIDS